MYLKGYQGDRIQGEGKVKECVRVQMEGEVLDGKFAWGRNNYIADRRKLLKKPNIVGWLMCDWWACVPSWGIKEDSSELYSGV